jgi:uncharacterized protein YcaQ
VPASPLQRLRAHAIGRSLFTPTTLDAAIGRLGFVQADPIRAPARAQDLILRHRVAGYRAGDLERDYPKLELEEAWFHVYGFLPRQVASLLHPRVARPLSKLDRQVLEAVAATPAIHPNDLAAQFGRRRVINGWGGYSKATKRALERLHFQGHLRIAGRDNGIRLYAVATLPTEPAAAASIRLRQQIRVAAELLAPVPETSLSAVAARLRRALPRAADHRTILREMLRGGELEKHSIDGLAYLWPSGVAHDEGAERRVRFLAPFDPVVWDRRRFEHLWQWPYRFEAYTPPGKRLRGQYAMPLLWGDAVIGWANAALDDGKLDVDLGFVEARPRDRAFRTALDAEIAALEAFLAPQAQT